VRKPTGAPVVVLAALALAGSAQGRFEEGAQPVFHGSIAAIDVAQRERMIGSSWHRGCPVPIKDLRLLTVDYWGFGGDVRRGRLILHEDQALRVKRVFRKLFFRDFRIRRMVLIDAYDGSDRRSMAANNTSAFNCRFVAGTTSWSQPRDRHQSDSEPVRLGQARLADRRRSVRGSHEARHGHDPRRRPSRAGLRGCQLEVGRPLEPLPGLHALLPERALR
jgi:hypothetical protein